MFLGSTSTEEKERKQVEQRETLSYDEVSVRASADWAVLKLDILGVLTQG